MRELNIKNADNPKSLVLGQSKRNDYGLFSEVEDSLNELVATVKKIGKVLAENA